MRRAKLRDAQIEGGQRRRVELVRAFMAAPEPRRGDRRIRTHEEAERFTRAELVLNRALAQPAVVEHVLPQSFHRERLGVRAVVVRHRFRGAGDALFEKAREPGPPD